MMTGVLITLGLDRSMKFALALAMVAAGVAARAPRSHELEGYTYEQYARDFGKVVSASGAANFARELKQILEHNRREGVTFRRGVNQYTDMEAPPRGMRRELLGHHRATSAAARPTPAEALPFALKPIEQLPPSVDWRERGVVTAVKDQGGCGSCWAFATTAVMESHVALATGTLFNLAPQELVSCMDNPSECGGTGGCAGATCELGYEFYMTNGGVVQEYQMGYTSYYGEDGACYLENNTRAAAAGGRRLRGGPDPEGITTGVANITGYTVLPSNNESALMNALASVGPVAITVAAMDWKNYEGGVYAPDAFDGDLDHAVVAVGYGHDAGLGLDYWIVRNSWSPTWGEAGYIRIKRSTDCGQDLTPLDGVACAGETDPVEVCGTSGMLYDSSFPTGATLI